MRGFLGSGVLFLILAGGLLFSMALFAAGPKVYEVGKTYHGFKLVAKRAVREIGAQALIFEHKKSGARLLKLAAADDNKTFCISFETLPDSDGGMPHILEHSVLNGSRKFPVKSPFEILVKGSLNTFLNAMTSSDFTMYPVASRNRKDFFNLMDVYLDAVFHPMILTEPRIFKQEGWRLELPAADAELAYNGIVYSEMKGAFSAPPRLMDYVVYKNLFPENTYGYESGGLPASIPDLTYSKFLAFYKKYYHPSNSYITIYGDGDTDGELVFVNNYLKDFKRSKDKVTLKTQKPFEKMKRVEADYSIAAGEDSKGKTFLSLNFVAGGAAETDLGMALDVLTSVLVDLPAAPVRRALQKAGIGKDVYATYDDIKQGVFSIVVKNADAGDRDGFEKVVFDTLKQVVKDGLDKKDIEGVINRTEFRLREADYGGFPKGLFYTYYALRPWMFSGKPLAPLEYEKTLKKVRTALCERYLEGLIQKHLLDNPHAVLAVVKPRPGMEEENQKKIEAKLTKIKASMTKKQIEELVEQTKELKAYQSAPDKPEDIAKIPMLTLADLDTKTEKLDVAESELDGVRVLHFPYQTNGIIYLRLMFDARVVPREMISYMPLLAHVLGQMDTAGYSYGQIDTELNIHTGGLSFGVETFPDFTDQAVFHPKFLAAAKVLTPKFGKLLELEGEVIENTRFGDKNRLHEVVGELNSRLQSLARGNGNYLAASRLASYLSANGNYQELTGGLSYIKFIASKMKALDAGADDLIADLQMLTGMVFNRRNLTIGVTCSAEDFKVFKKNIHLLLNRLADKQLDQQDLAIEANRANEGLLAASKVQYVQKGADFHKLGYEFSGKLVVLRQILSRDYLTQAIRVLGGAYGAWAVFGRDGLGYLASYRDPNLTKTVKAFDGAVDFLKNFKASDREMTRFIIGTIAGIDQPKTPAGMGRAAVSCYLRHIKEADRQKERDEVLATRQKDIQGFAKMVEDILKNAAICVYGNEKVLRDNKGLFGALVKVAD
ncbi:MAG TPA: insulinase family protein [Myxococcota bacterium]|nr:insulinase family protein [Myxococcota bacterium]